MNIQKTFGWSLFVLALALALFEPARVQAVGTAFTYQGRVNDGGVPANGIYDFQFTVYDSVESPGGGIVGVPFTNSATGVSNGLFTVTLDYGGEAFDGAGRWMEIAVRTNGAGNFTTLEPRQQITSAPYAILAGNSVSAESAESVLAGNVAGRLTSSQLPKTVLTNGSSGVNITGTFSGDGAGVTNFSPSSMYSPTPIVAWGDDTYGQTDVPAGLDDAIAVAAGDRYSLAVKRDGTVVAWGVGLQTNVPAGLSNVVAVATGSSTCLALKNNGTLVRWVGSPIPPGLSNVMAVVAGAGHNLALRSNKTVFAWGSNSFGETNVPTGLSNVVAVAAGLFLSVAARSDGTVIAWGANNFGQTNVPVGLSNVVALACGHEHSLALKSDGTVVAWGYDGSGETNVPAGLDNVVAIAAGAYHSLALRSDGTVVGWGENFDGNVANVTPGLSGVITMAQGCEASHVLMIRKVIPIVALRAGGNAFTGNQTIFGNLGIGNLNPTRLLVVGGSASAAACDGTSWINGSDRNAKQDFADISPLDILEKVSSLPITEWKYKVEAEGNRHVGPMAQDFHAAFGLNGKDETHISTVDESGVALAAIQGLNRKVESGSQKAEARIRILESENADLKARVEDLEKMFRAQKGK